MSRAHSQRVTDYLGHISQAIDRIQDYTASMTIDSFMADQKTCDAVIRNLEIIGEACNNVTKHHPEFAVFANTYIARQKLCFAKIKLFLNS